MPSAMEPRYFIERTTGQLFFEIARSRQIVGDIDLAISWTTDEDIGGCLHKHGKVEHVEKHAARLRAIDPTTQVAIIPWEAISHPEAGPKILEEVNACLAISGRVKNFDQRIAAIAAQHEIEVVPRGKVATPPEMEP